MDTEPNGELASTGNPLVDAALSRIRERHDERFRALEDAMIVQSEIERRQSALLKVHGDWLEAHEKAMSGHRERLDRIDLTLTEITDKLNALIGREMRREGL
jgi:hypothetical protein